ncbi:hypothetical protein AAFF_G00178280 [Aldrovandia affinis]|uniref:Cytoskeleton-associated protein 2 C-terminal domain-containing protein n=1 Tax=Aldrovandia affinis TaxID=143900 RepID=A0AAD7W6W2_9TELE|nr:hypothetical protein AAFF_G00178280 [Aldrovandia affinis]
MKKRTRGQTLQGAKLAEKKPQPSAGRTRAPLQAAQQFCASATVTTQATERSHFPATASTCPPATTRAKAPPHNAVAVQATPLTANEGPTVISLDRTCSKTVVSARNCPNAAVTGRPPLDTGTHSRIRPVTAAAAKTGPITSLAKIGPITTAQARTRPNTTTQSRTRSTTTAPPRTQPSATTQTTTRSTTTAQARAAPSRTAHNAAAPSKQGPNKATLTRASSSIPAAASKAAAKPIVRDRKSDSGSTLTKSHCGTFQKKAAVQMGKGGPVLSSTGSNTMNYGRRAEHGQSVLNKVSLNKPQAKATQGPTRPANVVGKAPQPQRPNLKGAAPQPSRTGSRAKASATHPGGAAEGQQVGALQRAARQAVAEMRKGRQWAESGTGVRLAEGESEDGRRATINRRSPTLAPTGRVGFTDLRHERELGSTSETIGAVPSTVPRTTKQTSLPREPSGLKTPARADGAGPGPGINGTVPPHGKRRLTAAQEERLQKLKEWREAKGISYKRPPMPTRQRSRKTISVPVHYWTAMEEEEEAHSLVYNIDRSLTDCIKLLQEGCSSEQVIDVLSRLPMAKKFAKYWICQARLMQREGNLEVLPMFEEAVRVVLEPVDDLRAVVFEILKKKEESAVVSEEGEGKWDDQGEGVAQQAAAVEPITPKATGAMIRGAKEGSSVVRYKITATPGSRRSQWQEPMTLDGQELRFLTPVRRSVRIQRSAPRYPAALQEHDPCVASFRDLPEGSEGPAEHAHSSALYIYRENEALSGQSLVANDNWRRSARTITGNPHNCHDLNEASHHVCLYQDQHIYLRTIMKSDTTASVTLHLQKAEDESMHMAFCFRYNKKLYYPSVLGKEIKLEAAEDERPFFGKEFLFKWAQTEGHWRSLQSVAQPQMFLSTAEEGMLTVDTETTLVFTLDNYNGQKKRK